MYILLSIPDINDRKQFFTLKENCNVSPSSITKNSLLYAKQVGYLKSLIYRLCPQVVQLRWKRKICTLPPKKDQLIKEKRQKVICDKCYKSINKMLHVIGCNNSRQNEINEKYLIKTLIMFFH